MPPKKEDKKPKSDGWNLDKVEATVVLLIILGIVSSILPAVIKSAGSGDFSFYGFKVSGIVDFFKSNIQFFRTLGFVVAGAAAIGTVIFTKKADAIWREERTRLSLKDTAKSSSSATSAENPMVGKWRKIVERSESQNPSDWRLAIIEADIILGDLLDKLQLPGETMGEKLKAVEKSDFTTIEHAWEAHKTRNMIAHEGSNFLLNQRETRRIISLYESVFREFFLI